MQVALPEALSAEATKRGIEEGLKRFATGLLRTVALGGAAGPAPAHGPSRAWSATSSNQLQGMLANDFNVEAADLAEGLAPDGGGPSDRG